MLLHSEEFRICNRTTGDVDCGMVSMIMGILNSSGTFREAEARRGRGCSYTLAQLFVVNLIREACGAQYAAVAPKLGPAVCRALGLPREGGRYRKPSVGTMNGFVKHVWPTMSEAFSLEYSAAVLSAELEEADGLLLTVDGTPMEASRYNFDADFNGHYRIRMDRMHIVMLNGHPLFGVHREGNVNDSEVLGELCALLSRIRGVHGRPFKIMMDAGYDSFHCYAEMYLATGCRPRCVIRSGAAIHPEASWHSIQGLYGRMHREEGFDPHRKNDEEFVLRFLARNGRSELVGMYLRNCEIERQAAEGGPAAGPDSGAEEASGAGAAPDAPDGGTAAGRDTDRQVCETVHHAMKRWVRFDVRGMRHATRKADADFKFACCQVLAAIFARYTSGPTVRSVREGAGAPRLHATAERTLPTSHQSRHGILWFVSARRPSGARKGAGSPCFDRPADAHGLP